MRLLPVKRSDLSATLPHRRRSLDATPKVYPGAPHGLAQTPAYKDIFNADMLAFIKA